MDVFTSYASVTSIRFPLFRDLHIYVYLLIGIQIVDHRAPMQELFATNLCCYQCKSL